MLYTDREALRTAAYGSTDPLRSRMAIYAYQQPRRDFRPLVASFLASVAGPLLDVGCGVGGYTRTLRSAGHPVVAADLSAAMANSAGLPALVADAAQLPVRDGCFGGAIALHMLYHLPEPTAALVELRRVLVPGGALVVSTNALDDKTELRAVHAAAARAAGGSIPDRGPAERFHLDAAELMVQGIFTSVQRHDIRSEVRVPVPDPVVAFIDSTRSWYGDGPDVLPHVERLVAEEIARSGAFTFHTHSGFLVCR